MYKQKIIVVLGPTASGKTSLGVEIAKKYNGEIISADSRTVYRKMNIGTAKPDCDLIEGDQYIVDGVVHYGFNLVDPDEHFQAFDFKEFAEARIKDILSRGKLPIIVGGTGLYISGLVDNFNFEGGQAGDSKFDTLQIGIKIDRAILYDRINNRVDEMIKGGLIEEVQKLNDEYGCEIKSMTGIGYRQICEYLNNKISIEEATENLKRDTRHYAKRQITWFKRDDRINWIENHLDGIKLVEKFL